MATFPTASSIPTEFSTGTTLWKYQSNTKNGSRMTANARKPLLVYRTTSDISPKMHACAPKQAIAKVARKLLSRYSGVTARSITDCGANSAHPPRTRNMAAIRRCATSEVIASL